MLDEMTFTFMQSQLKEHRPPLLRLSAAKGLSQARLNDAQLLRLTSSIAAAGPLDLPPLLSAFEKNSSPEIGQALVTALGKNASLVSLTPGAIETAVSSYPNEVKRQSNKLIERLQVDPGKQKARIDEFEPLTKGGSVEQGRDIYFGAKASCSACHAIKNKGGGSRTLCDRAPFAGRDLLSRSLPGASARICRMWSVTRVTQSNLARESTDAIICKRRSADSRWPRGNESFAGRVSIMPQGLETTLTRAQWDCWRTCSLAIALTSISTLQSPCNPRQFALGGVPAAMAAFTSSNLPRSSQIMRVTPEMFSSRG